MSAPKMWWWPRCAVVLEQHCEGGYITPSDNWLEDLPDDAIPLVPQSSRDELRDELAKALCPAPDECYGSPRGHCFRRADRVLDVLVARGLVASPETGEGG